MAALPVPRYGCMAIACTCAAIRGAAGGVPLLVVPSFVPHSLYGYPCRVTVQALPVTLRLPDCYRGADVPAGNGSFSRCGVLIPPALPDIPCDCATWSDSCWRWTRCCVAAAQRVQLQIYVCYRVTALRVRANVTYPAPFYVLVCRYLYAPFGSGVALSSPCWAGLDSVGTAPVLPVRYQVALIIASYR
jgi:hypothetical protein